MKTIFVIIAALAAVTFPVYFVVFVFKSLILGIMAGLILVIWLFGQLIIKLNIFVKGEQSHNTKYIGR